MGAYLSRPVKTKISEDECNEKLSYGVSSMQGWRLEQEDAHNCILEYDKDTALFAVYDGHGGIEVSLYTSKEFPTFLRNTEKYKQGLYEEALVEAFLGFDDTIATPDVLNQLNKIAKLEKENIKEGLENSERRAAECFRGECSGNSNDDTCDDDEDFDSLCRDANRPLEEVMASYCVPRLTKLINDVRDLKSRSSYLRTGCDNTSESSDESCLNTTENSTSRLVRNLNDVNNSGDNSSCASSEINGTSESNSSHQECSVEPAVNGDAVKSDLKCVSSTSTTSGASLNNSRSSKCSNKEPLINGMSLESFVNGVIRSINGKLDKNDNTEQSTTSTPIDTANNVFSSKPSTSPRKKKLALTDLEDSDVIKNFITSDEISETDDDDSEDETFHILKEDSNSDEDEKDNMSKCGELNEDDEKDEDDEEDDDDEDEDEDEEQEVGDEEKDNDDNNRECDGEDEFSKCWEKPGIDSGCTAVVALIKENNLYVANAGDSRCIICKDGNAVEMSKDHKPKDAIERSRITKAGGKVTSCGRVNDGLNLSRAIGDHGYKKNTNLPNTEQMITALPDVKVVKLEPDVEFIVLACDGIWDCMTNQEVVNFIRPKIQANEKLSNICEEMFEKCLAPHSYGNGTGCDNMTCIIVKLHHYSNSTTEILKNSKTEDSPISNDLTKISEAANETCVMAEMSEDNLVSEPEKALNKLEDVDKNCIINKTTDLKGQKRSSDLTEIEDDTCKRKKTENDDKESNSIDLKDELL